ncbi:MULTISPECIES: EpsG family protein [Eisenbergiella]|uniref:EpsG family protein n=1 Tax=Eisenbergiella porci TaxID=2652274 RepID=A0A6N7VXK8_9FIRM|nr:MULTISPECIES: EpsG family protein [Eisenbergiella]MDY2653004.1 EpsG family protein [Eisenbergiella porci]MSS87756.1 EpsG family protein [Eisenbergiella porci]
MIFYGLLGAVTIALACLVENRASCCAKAVGRMGMTRRQARSCAALFTLFLVLAGTAALRIDVGNDYGNYVNIFHEIYVGGYVVTEPGFNWLVRFLFLLSGGENYLLVFGLFAVVTAVIFLKAMYDQSVDFTLSFALFMLLGLYFRTFNTVRYYFVLAVTLYSLRYVLKREYSKFVLLILLAALFHKSVLVVIPLYLIAALPWKKWQVALGAAFAVSLPLFQGFWMKVVLWLYPSYQNTVYLQKETGLEGSLMGIIRCAAVLLLGLSAYRETIKENRANLFYFKLNLLGLALYTCASFLPLVSRFGYYLITAHVLLVPGILMGMPDEAPEPGGASALRLLKKGAGKKKKVMFFLTAAFCLLYFAYFLLTAHQEGVRVLPYHSWIFTEKEWLNGSFIF